MVHSSPDATSRSRIYRQIRRSIIAGDRRPGERLDLETLTRAHGTSVTPVRDALQMLSQEGLITIRPRSGYYVTHITLKQLRDMLELREILEEAAIKRAAVRITEEQVSELEGVHAGYSGEDDESYDRYVQENRDFHYLIAKASGNDELANALGRLLDRLTRFMHWSRGGATQEGRHARIVEILRSRDVDAACEAMIAEVTETRNVILENVIQEEGDFWRLGSRSPE
jgi:DNA-binding GntR family transcriptional regulator